MIFLPAITAEVGRIEKNLLVLTSRREPLRIQGDGPLTLRFQSAENLSGAADKLMELEGEKGASVGGLNVLGCLKEVDERLPRGFHLDSGVGDELLGSSRKGDRTGPLRASPFWQMHS